MRDAGISVCSGGILGLGESDDDRIGLIWEVAKSVHLPRFSICLMSIDAFHSLPEHPESFPVNALVPIAGTPLEKNEVNNIVASPLLLTKLSCDSHSHTRRFCAP